LCKKRKYSGRKILLGIGLMILLISAGCGQRGPENQPGSMQTSNGKATVIEEPEQAKEVECNWTLSVDDTETIKVNGYEMTCTIQIDAVKEGGTDIMGTYAGSAALIYEYDMQKGNVQGNAKGKGKDQNVSFDMVAYDVNAYSNHGVTLKKGDLPLLPPLTEQDAMGLGIFALTGGGNSKESVGSASWSTGESKIVQVPFKIAVGGSQAVIQLPTIAQGAIFKGIVTGTPIKKESDAGTAGSKVEPAKTTETTNAAEANETTTNSDTKGDSFKIYGKMADGLPENYPDQVVPIYKLKKIMNSAGNSWGFAFEYISTASYEDASAYYRELLRNKEDFEEEELSDETFHCKTSDWDINVNIRVMFYEVKVMIELYSLTWENNPYLE
jgi:hypothetical protein